MMIDVDVNLVSSLNCTYSQGRIWSDKPEKPKKPLLSGNLSVLDFSTPMKEFCYIPMGGPLPETLSCTKIGVRPLRETPEKK